MKKKASKVLVDKNGNTTEYYIREEKSPFTKANHIVAMEMIRKSALNVKAIKTFRGHDGDGYNCNIYWNHKMIGIANDFANGGELEVDFTYDDGNVHSHPYLTNLIESLPKGSWFEYSSGGGASWNIDAIVNFLVFDKLNEKEMKKMLKKVACYDTKKNTLSTWNCKAQEIDNVFNFKEEKGITLFEYIKKYNKDSIVLNPLPFDVCMEYWYQANPNTI